MPARVMNSILGWNSMTEVHNSLIRLGMGESGSDSGETWWKKERCLVEIRLFFASSRIY